MLRILPFLLLLAACGPPSPDSGLTASDYQTWSVYLGDATSSHYSTLDGINRSNVADLEVAWTYHTGDADSAGRSQIQCNPIIVDSVLFATSARLKVIALHAATGEEIWMFDPFEAGAVVEGPGINRGVVYLAGDENHSARILMSAGARLFALGCCHWYANCWIWRGRLR